MLQTLEPTLEVVTKAKADFESASQRLIHLFSFVPDDKLAWTPSATAKSALRIVAHCALTTEFFANLISGGMPGVIPSPTEFFQELDDDEKTVITRTQALDLMKTAAANLGSAMDTVNSATIESSPNSPFGPMPISSLLHDCREHLASHTGQLTYLQTIWGDLDNHM